MKTSRAFLLAVLVIMAAPASAEIIFQLGTPESFARFSTVSSPVMPSIVFAPPTASASPEISYMLQRGHAWSTYNRGDNASGAGLVLAPYGSVPMTARQATVRGNISRANAFRLDFFK